MDRAIINPNYVRFDIPNQQQNDTKQRFSVPVNTYNKLNRTLEVENNNKLPEDWIELIDSNTGKPYYACITTKHTQWLNPIIPIGTMMPNGLPYGWEKEYDPLSKKFYYINHVGRFNTWNPPVKQRGYLGNDYVW